MLIALVSFPANNIFQITIPYPYWVYLSNTLWIGLIIVVIWHYRKDIQSYF